MGSSSDSSGDEKVKKTKKQMKTTSYTNVFQKYLQQKSADAPEKKIESIPDGTSTTELMSIIAKDRNWTSEQIQSDIDILLDNRLTTVRDLRTLSKQSWKEVQLLPLVKDLLRLAINEKHKQAQASATDQVTGTTASGAILKPSESNPSRMLVQLSDGTKYETDRWCPHKGADLLEGEVRGSCVVCPRHHWLFDVTKGGVCDAKGRTINACQLNW